MDAEPAKVDDQYDLSHLEEGASPSSPEPEKAETAETPTEPAAPVHDPHLVDLALELGLSRAQIDALTPPHLAQTVAYWSKQELQRARVERERERVQAPPKEPAAETEEEDDLSEVHPAIRKTLEKQKKKLAELDEIKGRLQQREQIDEQRQQRSIEDAVDDAFDSLPKYAKVFGKGEARVMPRDSAEWKRRIAIYRQANIDPRVDSPGVIKKKISAAVKDVYDGIIPEEAAKPKPTPAGAYDEAEDEEADATPPAPKLKKNGKPTPEEWEEAGLARPTGRKSPPRPGEDATIEHIRRWKEANGKKVVGDQRPNGLAGIE